MTLVGKLRTFGLFVFAWTLFAGVPRAHAAETAANFWGKTITQITVTGLKRIEKDAALAKMFSKPGERLSEEGVQQDIKGLFSLGYFDDIDVQAEVAGDGVALTVAVQERPAVSQIDFEGNDRLETSDLKDVIKVKQWSILDINKVKEDIVLLQKHYEEKGFYLTKISYEIKPGAKGEVELIYHIKDYDKIQVKKITFLNNRRFSDEQLKSVFAETREGSAISFLTGSGSFKESAFKTDLQRLWMWYLEHGYPKFKFENPVVTVSDDKRYLFITIHVDEGEQYEIGEIDFGGDLLFTKEELKEGLVLKTGDRFSITKRNQDIQYLTEKYQDLGYAFANANPSYVYRDDEKKIDVTYQFEKGSLVYIGEINVLGNTKTHDKVIRRELRIHEGELFNGTKLRISRENVERLGYFAQGEVLFNQVTPPGKNDVVNIEISIKERSTGTITIGAGYGTAQGPFFSGQIAEINLFGTGRNLSLAAQAALGSLNQSFNLGLTDPYFLDTRWTAGVDLYSTLITIINKYSVRRNGFNLRGGYPLSEYVQAFATYKFEGLNILQSVSGLPPEVSAGDQGILSSVVLNIVRDKRNNRFETTDGNYQSFLMEFAGLGGDKTFIKAIANARFYKRVVGDLVFRNNNQVGQVWGLAGLAVPPSERFYLGGPSDMRGFYLLTLGPSVLNATNGTLIPTGGTFQYFSLFELEYPVFREAGVKAVVFFDVGNTVDRFPFSVRADAGFGIRWFSPIGPLRFEWGIPINPIGAEQMQFQFNIGQPF